MGIRSELRKILGTGRLFRRNYNRNRPNSLRHTRNQIPPVVKLVAVVAVLGALAVHPILGFIGGVTVYVALFMDADSGNLLSNAMGVVGAGLTALVVSVMTAFGAMKGAVNWYRSQ